VSTDTHEPTRRGGMSGREWLALAVIVPLVLIGAFVAATALGGDDEPTRVGLQIDTADVDQADHLYVIPAGTADRIRGGELVEIVPAELVVRVGESIRIVNDDTADHIVGVFFVGAGETLTQRFQSVGELVGDCSVHPSGSFTLRVLEA
jgi:hypothetical protein